MSFDDEISAGNKIIASALQSPNYAQGSSGWTINRDGSAEFQNVLVRGTITGSTIIGSTIIGGTIVGGDIQSSNFSNVAMTGFDLNANATTDPAGTPGNTIQIYTDVFVGPESGSNIRLTMVGSQPEIQLNTGDPAQTKPGTLFGGSSPNTFISLAGPQTTNGYAELVFFPPRANTPGQVELASISETLPTGNAVNQFLFVGSAPSDPWALQIYNPNRVNTPGTGGVFQPGIIIGDDSTPGARLALSINEVVAMSGAGAGVPLFLNDTSDSSLVGGLSNRSMRHASGFDAAQYNPTNAYTNPTAISMVVACPPSGVLTVLLKFCVVGSGAVVIGDFLVGSVTITNSRLGVVFAASDNRGAELDGNWLGANASDIVTLHYNLTATGLGAAGDTLTITPEFRQGTAGHYNIKKTEMSALPSM